MRGRLARRHPDLGPALRYVARDDTPADTRRATRVVVGVDFSVASLAAARWAGRVYGPGVELVLVHALPILTGKSLAGNDAARSRERAMTGALRGLAGLLGAGPIRTVVRRGSVADVLAAAASLTRARLVCIGRDELDTLRTRRIVERLLDRSAVGIAVVPREAREDATDSRIVVTVDAASASGPGLREAALLLANAAHRQASSTAAARDGRLLVIEASSHTDALVRDSAAAIGASIATLIVPRPGRAVRADVDDDAPETDAHGALRAIMCAPCPVVIPPASGALRAARRSRSGTAGGRRVRRSVRGR
jgi:hypothetical protein